MSDSPNPAPSGWARQKINGRVTIAFPVTPAERDLLRAAAKADGAQAVAAFVRRIALAEAKRLEKKAKK